MTDPIERSDALDKKMDAAGLPVEIKALARHITRTRRMVRLLAISVVVDVVLSVVVGVVAFKAEQATNDANQARRAVVASCVSGNAARAVQRDLWGFILSLPPPPTLTPAEAASRAAQTSQLKAYIATNLAARDCTPK